MGKDKDYYANRDKHRFLEMATCAMLVRTRLPPREMVNIASELWDEIEHQCPEPKYEDGE